MHLILDFRECLKGTIEHSESPEVNCPFKDDNYSCNMAILDREIKSVRLKIKRQPGVNFLNYFFVNRFCCLSLIYLFYFLQYIKWNDEWQATKIALNDS
jgi:hypothetical protein